MQLPGLSHIASVLVIVTLCRCCRAINSAATPADDDSRRPNLRSYAELLALAGHQAQQLRELQGQLDKRKHVELGSLDEELEPAGVPPISTQWSSKGLPLPPGPYNATCKQCARFGDSLWYATGTS